MCNTFLTTFIYCLFSNFIKKLKIFYKSNYTHFKQLFKILDSLTKKNCLTIYCLRIFFVAYKENFKIFPKRIMTLLSRLFLNNCLFYSAKGFTTINMNYHACIHSEASYRNSLVIYVTCMQFSGKFNYCVCAIFHGIF